MLPTDIQEILVVLKSGDFSKLIGRVENQHVEFKSQPYDLASERACLELAKDVSAFGNSGTGLIVIGASTERELTASVDIVRSVSPIHQGRIDIRQIEQIIRRYIYPAPRTITPLWHMSPEDNTYGVLSIMITPDASQLPYLTTKILDADDRIIGHQFGYFERRRGDAVPASVSELHALLQQGLVQKAGLAQFGLSLSVATQPKPQKTEAFSTELVQNRIERAVTEGQFMDRPTYSLVAYPNQPLDVSELLEGRDHPLIKTIEEPPKNRYAGFDLTTDRPTELIDAAVRRSMIPGYKLREVWRDGMVLFLAGGDDDYLCWANKSTDCKLINPLALTESLSLFVLYCREIYESMGQMPQQGTFGARLTQNENTNLQLVPSRVGGWRRSEDGCKLSALKKEVFLESRFDESPDVLAFRILREFYAWFGISADRIPYTKQLKDGLRAVDLTGAWDQQQ